MTKLKYMGGLGFRDIELFNLALLARQAWRLLQNPTSLCAKVLSARYYPGKSILEATPNKGISYVWRSILKGLQLLKKASYGGSEMGKISRFGLILGYQGKAPGKLSRKKDVIS